MAVETLGLPDPVSGNVNDGDTVYDLAVGFTTSVSGQALGVEWFTPTSDPGIVPVASWWDVGTGELVPDAQASFTAVPGTRQEILFPEPISIPAGSWRVSVRTIFFTLTSSWGGWPAGSEHMDTGNPDGWLNAGPGFPATGPVSSLYHMSPIWEPDGDPPDPAEGSATAPLSIGVVAAGSSPRAGVTAAPLSVGVTASGARPSQGSAVVPITIGAAAVGQRDSLGAAVAPVDISVSAQGVRASQGSAVVPVTVGVAATGSNGDTGCPVPVFPWAARPVKSFSEVEGSC